MSTSTDHTDEIAYLRANWESMGLEWEAGGDRLRILPDLEDEWLWMVEGFDEDEKWLDTEDTRSDFEALSLAEKILRDRLKRQCDKVSVSDHGHFVIVRIRRGDDRQSVSRDTAVEALHLACIALEAG